MPLKLPSHESLSNVVESKDLASLMHLINDMELLLSEANLKKDMPLDSSVLQAIKQSEEYLQSYSTDKSNELFHLDDARADFVVSYYSKNSSYNEFAGKLQQVVYALSELYSITEEYHENTSKIKDLSSQIAVTELQLQVNGTLVNNASGKRLLADKVLLGREKEYKDLQAKLNYLLESDITRKVEATQQSKLTLEISGLNKKIASVKKILNSDEINADNKNALYKSLAMLEDNLKDAETALLVVNQKLEDFKKEEEALSRQMLVAKKDYDTANEQSVGAKKILDDLIVDGRSLQNKIILMQIELVSEQDKSKSCVAKYEFYQSSANRKISSLQFFASLLDVAVANFEKAWSNAKKQAYDFSPYAYERLGSGLCSLARGTVGYLPSWWSQSAPRTNTKLTIDTSDISDSEQLPALIPADSDDEPALASDSDVEIVSSFSRVVR